MSTIYLNAGYDGTIYETSKTAKEGFETHISTKGNTSYRKVYKKGFWGIYKGMEERDSQIGAQLSVSLVDSANNPVYFQVSLKDQRGDISQFAESLLAKLPYLLPEYLYRFYAYNMPVEGTTYSNIGISVKHADTWESVVEEPKVGHLTQTYTRKEDGVEVVGHIPAIVWEDNAGSKKANKTNKNNYLYNTLATYGKVLAAKPAAKAPSAPVAQPVPFAVTPTPAPAAPPVPPALVAVPVPPAPFQPVAQPLSAQPVAPVAPPPPPPIPVAPVQPNPSPAAQPAPVAPVMPPPPPPAPVAQASAPVHAAGGQPVYVAPPTSKIAMDDLPF